MFRIKQEIEEQILRLQLADQVRYWVNQLDKMAAVKDCDMTRIEADSGSPFRDLVEQVLDRLGQIGSDSVVPMLKLACEWADKPERDDQGKLTGVFNVFVTLLRKVCKLGYANREIELMLRDFLEKSCRANEGRLLWGLMPFHCAKCLHELFERYPEPEIGNNTLTNRDQFLRPPLP